MLMVRYDYHVSGVEIREKAHHILAMVGCDEPSQSPSWLELQVDDQLYHLQHETLQADCLVIRLFGLG
jgi:hypothetical protein